VEGTQLLEFDDTPPPSDPDPTNLVDFERWRRTLRQHDEKVQVYKNFRAGLYNLVLGQCTDALQDKLKSHRDFEASNQNGIALLLIIRAPIHTFEGLVFLPDATANALKEF
jgi:hypothetical protein